ncbi:replication factor RFC1 C terminal domain-containing protein [Choanephora cucurbitarum]|nr:replication factor RFC1 C terminal domain-containing protein [Choanephora cucurbitarum]
MKSVEGPKALGTRPEPVGAPNCLDGLAFVISGQYETLTKEQTKDIVMRYGGRVTGAVSGKTHYLLRGRDAGESKLAKAKSVGTKILDEDEFYELVENSAEKKPSTAPPPKAAAPKTAKGKGKAAEAKTDTSSSLDTKSLLWTEKYKPTELKEIIGNKELVNTISQWLAQWQESLANGFEGSDIHSHRAVLLSGPPGIGKTTTANVVARVNGYEALEFNASDVRSKKILEESISEMMDNRTMTEFFQASKNQANRMIKGKKVVLIMDEVDGMSEGDRGGGAELARMIKESKIPVICICNDSRSQKVAPLLRVCYEAKFRRSTAAQIRSRILSIAYKENLNITPNAIDELVAATQNDIRQIINILSAYRINETSLSYDQAKTLGKSNQKNSTVGLFDIPGELLTGGSWRSKSLTEKYEVYFNDYSLSNLMIQENYLKCLPELARSETGNPKETACNEMDLFAKASEAIADGDLVDAMIHGTTQHWSLMPVHSIFSCVRPASFIRGGVQSRYNFPGWLGQNSKADKYSRQLSEVQARMRIKASGDKYEIRQNYIPTLNDRIIKELQDGDYDGAMEIMDSYYLDRECLDTFNDLTFAPTGKGPLAQLPTKIKSTLTRRYNNSKHPVLFQSIRPE